MTVVDPGEANASLVAAGMIAPAMESAVDAVSPQQARLLRAGRDLWPDFADTTGIDLARRPAEWRGGDVDGVESRLRDLGFAVRCDGDRAITNEDYQVEPAQALTALKQTPGVVLIRRRAAAMEQVDNHWRIRLDDGIVEASAVVLATGVGEAIAGSPPLTRRLVEAIQPIRGQIGVLKRALVDHVVRGPGAYVAPMTGGSVIGATMEPGRRDIVPDVATGKRLTEAAWKLIGRPDEPLDIDWRVGVRGASPDGLPMAGPAPDGKGLFLALAPRRNGWLLGPLVGSVIADAVEGRAPSPAARALDPRRF